MFSPVSIFIRRLHFSGFQRCVVRKKYVSEEHIPIFKAKVTLRSMIGQSVSLRGSRRLLFRKLRVCRCGALSRWQDKSVIRHHPSWSSGWKSKPGRKPARSRRKLEREQRRVEAVAAAAASVNGRGLQNHVIWNLRKWSPTFIQRGDARCPWSA